MSNLKYYAGRGNLACTIFVPYDCNNHCPFCTSKHMYKHMDVDLQQVLQRIEQINNCSAVTEFVITGGEPFADLEILKKIINVCNKTVFINTTLPLQDNLNEIIEYINTEDKIKGISISRHMNYKLPSIASKEQISQITKPIRINSIIADNELIIPFINEWKDIGLVNLRADYRKITFESLKVKNDIDDLLLSQYYYKGTNCCMVCNSEFFGSDDFTVCYHRGLELSSLQYGNKIYINDVLIYPNGNLAYDWDKRTSDDFINALTTNQIL